ncbi:hypothetical protein PpBr36_04749 [Pyricularia pennisetigena]|uniref:hypothetical protein n=1 Tax=Pyricularia pennisetigena TaxID=1578925 RepID=UPI001154E084|nr:hypothetical protein PpBr36_04749 [Pyricularia pennisetigena]TLS26452.1 hypothetical protein PpBr36_04749 [Pyricularia pennisetigena]
MDELAATQGLSFRHAIGLLAAIAVIYRLGLILYRSYFDPLSKFPGPKLYAISYLPYILRNNVYGTFYNDVKKLHDKYGPIVRISPNRISMDGSIAWQAVFARRPNQPEFGKYAPFYKSHGDVVGIFSAPREQHRLQRRIMGHAFSEAALREQWHLIKRYVDLLMMRFGELADADKPANVTRWYNYFTFDVMGDLAFADPFNSLEAGNFHPWIAMIFSSVTTLSRLHLIRQYPILRPFLGLLVNMEDLKRAAEHESLTVNKAEKRIAMGTATDRKDFMSYILQRNSGEKQAMSHRDLLTNAEGFIVAGSETTGTALCGTTYLLGRNRRAYDSLVSEIRNAFTTEEEIDMISTAKLVYLHACLEEGMRLYPPAVETPPRISPGDYLNDDLYIPKGTMVSVHQWATYRSAANFTDPETFAPQRFLPPTHPLYEEKYASDNKKAFRPFSAGPRDCIGKNLAYAEMRVVMARMLWNFDFELAPGQAGWMTNQQVLNIFKKPDLNVKFTRVSR